jgi:hypothetical protein
MQDLKTIYEKTLFLETRGCDFFKSDKINELSDIGNYRVYAFNIMAKNGINYLLEMTRTQKRQWRTTHKKTNKPLKKPIMEILSENSLFIDNEYENEKGSWRDLNFYKTFDLEKYDFSYTKKDVLQAINIISIKQYSNIVFTCNLEHIEKLNFYYDLANNEGKAILQDLAKIKHIEYTNNKRTIQFISNKGEKVYFDLLNNKYFN